MSTDTAIVMAISLFVTSSSSSPEACAEKDKAFIPITKDSNKATTPRRNGNFNTGYLSWIDFVGSSFTVMVPSGLRQAVAIIFGPRIITPSMTACPPTYFFTRS